jgi:hypothetical protein
MSGQGHKYPLKVSASLRSSNVAPFGWAWLSGMEESTLLLSSLIRVMHPDLFEMGLEATAKMHQNPDLAEALLIWTSIFNGVQVISNRETPVHRDHFSRWEWYDLLVTLGPYANATLEIPTVGLRFKYSSGTVVALCGRILRHGVSEVDGERICLAYYMRENVQHRLGTNYASWSRWDCHRE